MIHLPRRRDEDVRIARANDLSFSLSKFAMIHLPSRRDEDVRRLDVPVDDALRVQVVQPLEHLSRKSIMRSLDHEELRSSGT